MTYIYESITVRKENFIMPTTNTAKLFFLTDDQIIDLYWSRNETAIEHTDIKYGKFLFRIAYNVLHDEYACEECQNDTYLGVWKAIPPTRPTVFQAFITKIMRRIAINKYREKTAKKSISSEFTVSIDDLYNTLHSDINVENEYETRELGEIINNYVRALSKNNRYIFIGRFYMNDSVESIANQLNVSISSIYKSLKRIKKGLKILFEQKGIHI